MDCLLVSSAANSYYLTGFTGESGLVLVAARGTILLTDARFTVQAHEEAPGIRVELAKKELYAAAGELLSRRGFLRVGYDQGQTTVAQLRALRKAGGAKCREIAAGGVVEGFRTRKDAQELTLMRRAALLAGEVFTAVVPLLKPGVREDEIAAEISYQMRKRGASGESFPSIVASGARSALPHARPTRKRLRKNELVVLDLGAILGHYCSDLTRTVHIGTASRRVRRWYRAVAEAQQAAIEAVKAGVRCGDVDGAAREVLQKNGLDRYFVHSTGHGLGLEVHELPRVARGQEIRLEAGNVITIEPGVYVEGVGGIRIEDDVVVHFNRSEALTCVERDLIEL